jgi:hypothetical protein
MQFTTASGNSFTLEELISQEQVILNALQWDINLPNLLTWINYATVNWDYFIDNLDSFFPDFPINVNFLLPFKFRDQSIQSLNLFRSLTQFLDIIILDIEYLSFNEKYLTNSIIFLLILKCFGMVDFIEIPFLRRIDIDHIIEIVDLFNRYLNRFYNVNIDNIFDHIQYCSCYMDSILNFDNLEDMDQVNFI